MTTNSTRPVMRNGEDDFALLRFGSGSTSTKARSGNPVGVVGPGFLGPLAAAALSASFASPAAAGAASGLPWPLGTGVLEMTVASVMMGVLPGPGVQGRFGCFPVVSCWGASAFGGSAAGLGGSGAGAADGGTALPAGSGVAAAAAAVAAAARPGWRAAAPPPWSSPTAAHPSLPRMSREMAAARSGPRPSIIARCAFGACQSAWSSWALGTLGEKNGASVPNMILSGPARSISSLRLSGW